MAVRLQSLKFPSLYVPQNNGAGVRNGPCGYLYMRASSASSGDSKGCGTMLPGWAIAVTEPRSEAKAVASVAQLGYKVFYPKVIKRVRHRGQRVQILSALFPGYFFAWVERCWINLLAANGVAGILMEGDQIATVRDRTMKELKDRCTKNGVYLDPVRPHFQIGQRVRPSSGVLADKVGIFDGTTGQHDAALFNLLGAQTRVLFKEGTLVAV